MMTYCDDNAITFLSLSLSHSHRLDSRFHYYSFHSQLKTLSVILKNLIDPLKGGASATSSSNGNDDDNNSNNGENSSAAAAAATLKYRTLKLDNPKLASRLFSTSHTQDLLLQLGFAKVVVVLDENDSNTNNTTTTTVLQMSQAPSPATIATVRNTLLPAIAKQQSSLAETASNKKAKTTYDNEVDDFSKLSEKQKARRLLQQKQEQDKQHAKQARLLTKAQIAADKRVRQDDENWKPAVSAAADKTGTGLQTFRDRHGE